MLTQTPGWPSGTMAGKSVAFPFHVVFSVTFGKREEFTCREVRDNNGFWFDVCQIRTSSHPTYGSYGSE